MSIKFKTRIHPGKILANYIGEESKTKVAEELGISRVGLSKIINGHTRITERMAVKLAKKYGTDEMFWIEMSVKYELWKIKQEADI